jgi:hypothetical protein
MDHALPRQAPSPTEVTSADGAGKGGALHPESLLRIPLLSQVFDDPAITIVRRGIDARWKYEEAIETRVDGFNPLRSAVFIGTHSRLDRWLPHRRGSARPFNEGDALVPEALFCAHDYLHSWAYHWIDRLRPGLGFGCNPITAANFEDMVFCHILSEAVATVGLDYWYLSTVDLNEVVPIGTVQKGLTVSYREEWSEEYRRFNPGLVVQHPAFLGELTRFYCDGVFVGFDVGDLQRSPALHNWVVHELTYGRLQRRYCRQWFAYLSADDIRLSDRRLDAPIGCDEAWKQRLVGDIGERLWAKVKRGEMCTAGRRLDPERSWKAPPRRAPDFRFLNLNRCEPLSSAIVEAMPKEAFEFLLRQYVARFDYESFPAEALGVFTLMREGQDLSIGDRLLGGMARLPQGAAEPRDLFLYN